MALKDDTCIFIQPDIPCLYSSGKHEFHPLPLPIGDEGLSFERLPRNSLKFLKENEGAWKNSEKDFFVGPMNIRFNMFVYLRKKLFLISNSSPSAFRDKDGHYLPPYIMAYDFVAGGESMIVNLPEDTLEDSLDWCCDLRIFEWGKEKSSDHSLCLVKYIRDSFTIWVFTEFKSSNKWRKILEVGVKEMGVEEENPNVRGINVINGNCLIFATGRKVYGYYYFNDQSCWRLKEICEHNYWDYNSINLTPYSPTFRPCGTNESSIVSTRP
ncbi:hypothetical protein PIB30_047712 [Stylosanthes scabra]|uniref:F-box associated domain-containing protein n=1 Tax=Stylosanthes scabra TaxID=79078 RepID=A0ABU6TGI8_9FABA|nr:hypothetical protein [Stylosanthes scabra]